MRWINFSKMKVIYGIPECHWAQGKRWFSEKCYVYCLLSINGHASATECVCRNCLHWALSMENGLCLWGLLYSKINSCQGFPICRTRRKKAERTRSWPSVSCLHISWIGTYLPRLMSFYFKVKKFPQLIDYRIVFSWLWQSKLSCDVGAVLTALLLEGMCSSCIRFGSYSASCLNCMKGHIISCEGCVVREASLEWTWHVSDLPSVAFFWLLCIPGP